MPEVLRRKYFFAFLRELASGVGLHFLSLLWLLRPENGEQTGRRHYHALVGGLPQHVLSDRYCLRLMAVWEHQRPLVRRIGPDGKPQELSKFCGMARIRIFNPSLDGLEYCLPSHGKEARSSGWSLSGANSYEANKFGGSTEVELSQSTAAYLKARQRRYWLGDARCGQNGSSADSVNTTQRSVSLSQCVPALRMPVASCEIVTTPALTVQTALNHVQGSSPLQTERKQAWQAHSDGIYERVA
jgi:hypothetical protein